MNYNGSTTCTARLSDRSCCATSRRFDFYTEQIFYDQHIVVTGLAVSVGMLVYLLVKVPKIQEGVPRLGLRFKKR